jgi:CBS domain-containing protein
MHISLLVSIVTKLLHPNLRQFAIVLLLMAIPTAKDLLKNEDIVTCSPEDTLSKATAQLESSHDAVFIMDGDKFKGVVNPYHAYFRQNLPAETKAKKAAFNPPKLSPDTLLPEIARVMIESKVYFLPVLENGDTMSGIVTINRVLRYLLDHQDFLETLPNVSYITDLVTIERGQTMQQARKLMIDHKISRLPVVDDSGTLVGIVSRRDLSQGLATPIDSPNYLSRKGNKEVFLDAKVDPFVQKNVITTQSTDSLSSVIYLMVEEGVGSVIITDRNLRPTGMVTNKAILESIAQLQSINQYNRVMS